jgi:hypothetical protein
LTRALRAALRAQAKEFRLIRHRDTEKPRGCFITLSDADGCKRALTRDNGLLRGRPMRVDVAEARPERSSGGASQRPRAHAQRHAATRTAPASCPACICAAFALFAAPRKNNLALTSVTCIAALRRLW